jgi:hypothetical protein
MRALLSICVLLASLALLPAAVAAGPWDYWRNLGGPVIETPVCTSWGVNRIDCFGRGRDRSLYHWWRDGGNSNFDQGWSGPQSLGGTLSDRPSCVNWGPNHLHCFALLSDGSLGQISWPGHDYPGIHGWSFWHRLSGRILESPSCVSYAPNRIDCFARGGDRAMYHWWWDGIRWLGWERLGGVLISPVQCSSGQPDRLQCIALGTDHFPYRYWWDGHSWHGWSPIGTGVRMLERPGCANNTFYEGRRDEIACAGRNRAGHLIVIRQNVDGSFGNWRVIRAGIEVHAGVQCKLLDGGEISCFVPDTHGALLQFRKMQQDSFFFTHNLGGVLTQPAECLTVLGRRNADDYGQIFTPCFALDSDGSLRWTMAVADDDHIDDAQPR